MKRLVKATREAAANQRGEIVLTEYEVTVPETVGVAAFGLDVDAVQAWEQHRRRPDRTARILLAVIAREPEAVRRALAG